jgi:hypothetical protein
MQHRHARQQLTHAFSTALQTHALQTRLDAARKLAAATGQPVAAPLQSDLLHSKNDLSRSGVHLPIAILPAHVSAIDARSTSGTFPVYALPCCNPLPQATGRHSPAHGRTYGAVPACNESHLMTVTSWTSDDTALAANTIPQRAGSSPIPQQCADERSGGGAGRSQITRRARGKGRQGSGLQRKGLMVVQGVRKLQVPLSARTTVTTGPHRPSRPCIANHACSEDEHVVHVARLLLSLKGL